MNIMSYWLNITLFFVNIASRAVQLFKKKPAIDPFGI